MANIDVVDSVEQCTHVVTDKDRRTVKLLSGVALGRVVVTPSWAEASARLGTPVGNGDPVAHGAHIAGRKSRPLWLSSRN